MSWKTGFIMLLLGYSVPALSDDNIFFEKCNWCNRDYTNRIVEEGNQVPLLDAVSVKDCLTCSLPDSITNADGISQAIQNINQNSTNIPKVCFFASMIRPGLKSRTWKPGTDHYYYCYSAHDDKQHYFMSYNKECSKKNLPGCQSPETKDSKCHLVNNASLVHGNRHLRPRRPCLNKDYLDLTARTFNEVANCFGFSAKEKKHLFALMNHESSFWINKRGHYSTARCYGQIKNSTIDTVNRNIYFGNPDIGTGFANGYSRYGEIYKQVTEKCPYLKNTIVPAGILDSNIKSEKSWQAKHYESVSRYRTRKRHTSQEKKCRTSQDPYSCLFYSFYNARQLLADIEEKLKEVPRYSKIPDKKIRSKKAFGSAQGLAKTFKLPLKTNEILIVRFQDREDGNKLKKYVFKDSREAFNFFAKRKFNKYKSRDFKVKKMDLFNEEDFKYSLLHYGHNGGSSIPLDRIHPFMSDLKTKISLKVRNYHAQCRRKWNKRNRQTDRKTDIPVCRAAKRYKQYRETVLKGKPLSSGALHEEFASYVHEYNNSFDKELGMSKVAYNQNVREHNRVVKKNPDCKTAKGKKLASCKRQKRVFVLNSELESFAQDIKQDLTTLGYSLGASGYFKRLKKAGQKYPAKALQFREHIEKMCPQLSELFIN